MKKKVQIWMRENRDEYIDEVGEIDFTALAEAAAEEFDLFEGFDYIIPEWVFELACEC